MNLLKITFLTKKIKFFFILFTIYNFSFSQNTSFEKAKIYYANNEIIESYVNTNRIYNNKIFFKRTIESEIESVDISVLSKIEFENETYLIRDVVLDIDRENFKLNIDNNEILKPNLFSKKIILKKLLESDISLLYSDIKNKDYFFVEDESGNIEYLIYNEFYYNKVLRFDNSYKKQLSNVLNCDNITNELLNINYNEKDLKNIFISYYNCKKIDFISHKNSNVKNKIFINLISGVKFFNYKFNSNVFAGNNLKSSTTNFTFGVESGIKFKNNDVFLRAGVEKVEFSKQYKYNDSDLLDNIIFEATFLNLNLGYRKYFNINKNSKFYTDASIEYTLIFNDKLKSIISDNINPDRDEENYTSYKSNSSLFINLGLGYTYNKFALELRYSLPKDLYGNFSPISSKISNVNVNFIYSLM